MIGIILCGHAHFGTGLYSTVRLIAGEQENFEVIDYEEGMTSEALSMKLSDTIEKLQSAEGVAILTDIAGGTPFNEAAKLSVTKENVTVISGVNAPVLLDSCFKRNLPISQFIEEIVQSGKDGMKVFKVK
ncbi:PTS sugar transporter subunit IIA [Neobacillus sp. YIM B02564]|uniref:PTS sugar transporter subunit IIA n=1 Tax=Neobacillus paridis TaxID=2803862 RepID=A0ABS1TKZ2_9BACI|nr:PTS sugar transporter subunit IIA [Neobacillus paridis]MBL4951858.1 PTS sugar transporter subunit IIA [Neobacillus paridis]